MTVRARAAGLSFLLVVALGACGSSGGSDGGADGGCNLTPSRSPKAGEGTQCTLVDGGGPSNCPGGLDCADWSSYAEGFGACRIPCGQSCPTGETCTCPTGESCTQDQGGTNTMSCQCTPAESPCGTADSCASFGLECNPDFHVCQAPVSSTSCTTPLRYSSLWQLCLSS